MLNLMETIYLFIPLRHQSYISGKFLQNIFSGIQNLNYVRDKSWSKKIGKDKLSYCHHYLCTYTLPTPVLLGVIFTDKMIFKNKLQYQLTLSYCFKTNDRQQLMYMSLTVSILDGKLLKTCHHIDLLGQTE